MAQAQTIPFVKMNGLGNEILVLDAREWRLDLAPNAVRCLHAGGLTFDQIMLLESARDGADAHMRIYNNDGSEVSACGNGTRCVADLLMRQSGADSVVLASPAGRLDAWRAEGGVAVDMGPPRLAWDKVPLAHAVADTRAVQLEPALAGSAALGPFSAVSIGNPHAVFWVSDIDAHDLASLGPAIEHHRLFPERVNVSLARITGPDAIALKVWERGAGLTRACGTAACAAAVAATATGRTGRRVAVALPGGRLDIEWRADGHVVMTGPVETEFSGTLDPVTFAVEAA